MLFVNVYANHSSSQNFPLLKHFIINFSIYSLETDVLSGVVKTFLRIEETFHYETHYSSNIIEYTGAIKSSHHVVLISPERVAILSLFLFCNNESEAKRIGANHIM